MKPEGPQAPLRAFQGYGVELEYMIVSGLTLDVAPAAGSALAALAGGNGGGTPPAEVIDGDFGWSNELVSHLLELKNPRPLPALDGIAGAMQERIAEMNGLLGPLGLRLMPGGMHPWMVPKLDTVLWQHHNGAIYAAYDRIFDCRTHGWANLQSQHLNLPFAGDDEFARLHAAIRIVLPILPAMAASSPFIEGRKADFLDARLEAYRAHAAAVPSLTGPLIPDTATSARQYRQGVLEPIYRDIAPLDPDGTLQHEWINARAVIPRFDRSALEIRLLDTQECPAADLGIAALVTDTVRYVFDGHCSPLETQQAFPTQRLSRILVDCARNAEDAAIEDAGYLRLLGYEGAACNAAALWGDLVQRMDAAGTPMRHAWHDTAARVLSEGTLAKRLLAAAGPQPSRERLYEVYESLCTCLARGQAFSA
jgi:carboxylate-amine ligase